MVPFPPYSIIDKEIFDIGLDFGAQVWWRFLCFRCLPYQFGVLIHPQIDDETKLVFLQCVYKLHRDCCLNEHFDRKVVDIWPNFEELFVNVEGRRIFNKDGG